MQTCPIHERSARGYCPDDTDGHAAEREALLEAEPETTVAETSTAKAPPGELPATGVEVPVLAGAALLLVAVGQALAGGGRR